MGHGKITGGLFLGYTVDYTHNNRYLGTTAGPYLTRRKAESVLAQLQAEDDLKTATELGNDELRGTFLTRTPGRNRHQCEPPENLAGYYGDGTVWMCNTCHKQWICHGGFFQSE